MAVWFLQACFLQQLAMLLDEGDMKETWIYFVSLKPDVQLAINAACYIISHNFFNVKKILS